MCFVGLMKTIPTSEFMFDDIQRILRFVKARRFESDFVVDGSDSVTERDYFDAIELSGHIAKS